MKVKPAKGIQVRDPQTGAPIPESGIEVRANPSYWDRRLRCGDVVEVKDMPAPAPAAPAKKS